MKYADLHMHTNHSDGVCEIKDVLKDAKAHGLEVISITDHDTINHYDEIFKEATKIGLKVIKGVEMSCYDFDVYKKVHIVGLWINPSCPHIESLCSKTLASRDAYHKELIEDLRKQGYDISYSDAKKYSKYSIVFKMNIFQALQEKYPKEMTPQKYKELFASKTSKETDLKMGYIPVKEGIQAILNDGGIPVLAHPCQYDNYAEIQKYVEYGLMGIEINHSKMKEKDYPLVQYYADKFHLLKSGGSDYHDPKLITFGQFGLTKKEFTDLESAVSTLRKI